WITSSASAGSLITESATDKYRFLVDRYQEPSLALALSVIKDPAEAEDVIQEAFVKAYKNLARFQGQSAFSTWLYRIVVNTAYTAAKRRKRRSKFNEEYAHVAHSAPGIPLQELSNKERRQKIREVLSRMKPKESLALRLYYLGEQSIPEMAQVMDISLSNAKVLLHRARKSFDKKLERDLGGEKYNLL
ncbi:MAG: sigma-70 family RNA polymerase sigma factor, partial [Bacteroidota bacterium]